MNDYSKAARLILVNSIQHTIGMESKELSNVAQISIPNLELEAFLKSMTNEERALFVNSVFSFWIYYKAIKPADGVSGISNIWTNFIVLILFGLVENIMYEHKYCDCYSYLKSKVSKDCNTEEILEEWRKLYGESEKIRIFFDRFISVKEQDEIIKALKKDPKWKGVDTLSSFVKRVAKYRNEFVHSLSLQGIDVSNVRMEIQEEESKEEIKSLWYPTISIDMLIHYILQGVFRKLDKSGVLQTYLQ